MQNLVRLPETSELYDYMIAHSQRSQNIGVIDEILQAVVELSEMKMQYANAPVENLPLSADEHASVQLDTDDDGTVMYRHIIYTQWQPLPKDLE